MKKLTLLGIFLVVLILFLVSATEDWVERYDGPANGRDSASAIVTDSTGVYVAGYSDGGANRDFVILKYDLNTGAPLWAAPARYDNGGDDGASAIAIDSTGVYVAGYSDGGANRDFVILKYDLNTGAPLWAAPARYDNGGDDGVSAIAIDSTGVYVTGSSNGGTNDDYATLKYDLNTGAPLWAAPARYDNGSDDMVSGGMAVDSSGVYITGWSEDALGLRTDYTTVKYDNSTGTEQWVRRYIYPGDHMDYPSDIAIDGSGNVYVTGRSVGDMGKYDYATIKYSPGGEELWVRRYTGTEGAADTAEAMAVDSSGNVYVTGLDWANLDFVTIKYDTDGDELWIVNYNGPNDSYDDPIDLAIDSSGNVYVTGESAGIGTNTDYATVKYNTNGMEEWVFRYNGDVNGYDIPRAITVDLSGNVYVTGESDGDGTNLDFATIKYSQEMDPVIQIENLVANVESLVSTGVLNKGQGNALIAKLDGALKKLEKGNTKAACNQLGAFVNQVNAYINSGKLTPEQGQALIDAADAVIDQLCD